MRKDGETLHIRYGIMDDIAPGGSPDTACQIDFENAVKRGEVVVERIEIAPGLYEARIIRIVNQEKAKRV